MNSHYIAHSTVSKHWVDNVKLEINVSYTVFQAIGDPLGGFTSLFIQSCNNTIVRLHFSNSSLLPDRLSVVWIQLSPCPTDIQFKLQTGPSFHILSRILDSYPTPQKRHFNHSVIALVMGLMKKEIPCISPSIS